jgi:hypothetical protein
LFGEELADDGDLLGLLPGELGAPGVAVDILRLLTLFDHLGEKLEQFRVSRLTLTETSCGNVAILDGGGDPAQRRDAALVLCLSRSFECGGDGLAHGSDRKGIEEEVSKVIEWSDASKGFCSDNSLF